ncbi:MAG TPA: hypothetical protein VGM94_12810 [Galbitalea sp.]|jgi:hypothetical protein
MSNLSTNHTPIELASLLAEVANYLAGDAPAPHSESVTAAAFLLLSLSDDAAGAAKLVPAANLDTDGSLSGWSQVEMPAHGDYSIWLDNDNDNATWQMIVDGPHRPLMTVDESRAFVIDVARAVNLTEYLTVKGASTTR